MKIMTPIISGLVIIFAQTGFCQSNSKIPNELLSANAEIINESDIDSIRGEGITLAAVAAYGTYQAASWAIRSGANYVAKKRGWRIRFTYFAPTCVGEGCSP